MNAPNNPVQMLSKKTDGELLAMLGSPADWPAETLAAANVELWKRHAESKRTGPARNSPTTQPPPQLSSLAVYSLVLCLLPYIGLPMAVAALRRIARSEGRLYGRKLAWASIVINSLGLIFTLAVCALAVLMGLAGGSLFGPGSAWYLLGSPA